MGAFIIRVIFLFLLIFITSCSGDNSTQSVEDVGDGDNIEPINYTLHSTGNSNINTTPYGGIVLMGGSSEDDNAMRWFLNRASGGDIVVLRTSGSDGYNQYMYQDLGVSVNSVNTIVFTEPSEHYNIISLINNAEGIWFAGGDQSTYINYWNNSAIQQAIKNAISRNVVIGGTSAGMAIFGDCVWTGEEIIGDFLDIPMFDGIIFDTHFSERNRLERLKGFINSSPCDIGIGADETTAITFDTDSLFTVYASSNEKKVTFINSEMSVQQVDSSPTGNGPFTIDDVFPSSIPTGLISKTMMYDSETREYLIYIPSIYDHNSPTPILFAFHGFGGYNQYFINTADFRTLADQFNFIAVYPQGLVCGDGTTWNTHPPGGDNKCSQDDIGFFGALLYEISGNYNIDASKVFLTGYSNGADFSYSMACYQSSLVTSIAPVSGLMPMVDASSECQPSHATSVMIFNGTNDYSRPYNGIAGYMMSVDQTVAYWSQYNNTDSSPQTNIVGDIENYTYLNGDNNTIIDLFKIVNGDHYWFNLSYNGNSMEELMWNFFSSN